MLFEFFARVYAVCVLCMKQEERRLRFFFNGYTCRICVDRVFRSRPWTRNIETALRTARGLFCSLLFRSSAGTPIVMREKSGDPHLVISLDSDAATGSNFLAILLMRPATLVTAFWLLGGGRHAT